MNNMKLTKEIMYKWESDNGEDFIMSGPLSYEDHMLAEERMIENMKNSKRGLKLIKMVIGDDNYYLESVADVTEYIDIAGLCEISENIHDEVYDFFSNAFNELGFNYIAE